MNQTTNPQSSETGKPGWIGIGFVGAFALSVLTVIYTGLNVQRHGAAFDGGFRSITMGVGDVRTVELVFQSEVLVDDAILEVDLPEMVVFSNPSSGQQAEMPVALDIGSNRFSIDIEATEAGRGYLRTRVVKDLPIDVYRVFVTVDGD